MESIATDIDEVHRSLVGGGALEPLTPGGEDERAWRDCDLASLAENRLGDRTDPRTLDPARRAEWEARATTERLCMPSARTYERCYWLVEHGLRAGTIALATSSLGTAVVHLSSFYVYPSHRHQGVGARAFEHVRRALFARGLGLRLDTNWSWQASVRWYIRAGLWVRMWKRDLELCAYPGEPRPLIEVGEHRAALAVEIDGKKMVLAEADRIEDRLMMEERVPEEIRRLGEFAWHAHSTLSLALALAAWPLVRSRAAWDKSYWADASAPEALAHKITIWEAWDRKHGWRVETPTIPGLEYPTWAEFESKWASPD